MIGESIKLPCFELLVAELKVENVIAASHLGKELELVRLATEMPNARYSGSGNPSVIVEVDTESNKRAAGIVFGNGKIQVTGINSLNESRQVMESLKNMVKDIDSKVNMKRATKLENIVAKANLGRTLDLQAIALAIPTLFRIPPDISPGNCKLIPFRFTRSKGSSTID